MDKPIAQIALRLQAYRAGLCWRQLAGDILLLTAFALTSSWLVKP